MNTGRLHCRQEGCDYFCPVGSTGLVDHTMRVHGRRPSVLERTPVITNPVDELLELDTAQRGSIEWVLALVGRRRVDPDGRVWCCPYDDFYGLTRIDGVWWSARRSPFTPLVQITNSAALVALDEWELNTIPTDGDPTLANPPRPLVAI
jgi:hypothetical protein